MKLNNRGWGLSTFVILVCILLCALIIAVSIGIKLLGGKINIDFDNGTNSGNVNYIDLEDKYEKAAAKYQKKYHADILDGDRFIVTNKNLKAENLITDNSNCTGYVTFIKNNTITYDAYLKCSDYTTKGYEMRLDS